MLRNLLSLGDDAVRDLVRVLLALAALLALRPAAQLGVCASCAGLGARRGSASFTSGLSGQLAAVWRPFVGYWKTKDRTASIDRIDSKRPYESGNVQWVHKRVNIMKNGLSDADFLQWVDVIFKHHHE